MILQHFLLLLCSFLTLGQSFWHKHVPTMSPRKPLSTSLRNVNVHLEPWQVFPAHQWETLRQTHGSNVKLIHLVRHAEGTHNVNQEYKSEINIDARLTTKGKQQCQELANRIRSDTTTTGSTAFPSLLKPEDTCILTSPLTRCIETALQCFPDWIPHLSVLAQESWRETVNYNCDRRRSRQEIQEEFPHVVLGDCIDQEDEIWKSYRQRLGDDWDTHMESAELYRVAERGVQGLRALEQRSESQIVVCTHSAFLRCLLNWGQEGGVPKLMPQCLDTRKDATDTKLLHYANDMVLLHETGDELSFEEYMRRDFENCELRSFCMLVRS